MKQQIIREQVMTFPQPARYTETNPMLTQISKKALWGGRILSGFAIAFFLADGIAKLFKPAAVVEGTLQLGYPESVIVWLGIILITCTLLYVIPRTSILGAVLLTGYLGGAVATHVRVSGPWFNILFPVVFGGFVWAGLWLRDQRVRALLR